MSGVVVHFTLFPGESPAWKSKERTSDRLYSVAFIQSHAEMVYFNIFQVHFIQTIIHFTVLVITNQVLIFHDLKIRFKNLSGMSKRLVIRWSLARFPWSACRKVLGQDTEPHTAPDVLVCSLHGSYHHQCMNVRMNYCKLLWTKASAKCPQCKCRRVCLQQP